MLKDKLSRITDLFRKRAYAYKLVFDKNNQFTSVVLKDLAKFCRAHDSTFDKDERRHAALEGRREVWLRIQEHMGFEPDELLKLHRAHDLGDNQ